MITRKVLMKVVLHSVRNVLRIVRGSEYAEDGLGAARITDFLFSGKFVGAYEMGKSTGSWGSGDLRWRVFVACWMAQYAKSIPRDFVECGVNRGGMARAVMECVNFLPWTRSSIFSTHTPEFRMKLSTPLPGLRLTIRNASKTSRRRLHSIPMFKSSEELCR
jgi:hypothetical protein